MNRKQKMDALKFALGKIIDALKAMSSIRLAHGNLSASSVVFDVASPTKILLVDRSMALDQT